MPKKVLASMYIPFIKKYLVLSHTTPDPIAPPYCNYCNDYYLGSEFLHTCAEKIKMSNMQQGYFE